MYYKRIYEEIITKLSGYFPVIILTGARQSGKTTLLKHKFPQYSYVSLDLPSLAEQAENNPEEFFKIHKAPLIIDEVQYAPRIFRYIKVLVEENRHLTGQYILTGSQKFSLMKEVSESLAGRSVLLDLENLSWSEINNKNQTIPDVSALMHLMLRGQFPELWRVPEMPETPFYNSYTATYLERDVRQILNVTSLRDFERFLRALAPRSGQLLNKTDIARDVGVSVKAINDWISVLEASNQVVLLEPWYHNFSKRIVKSPKVYFCDSGLLCFLLGINLNNLSTSPFKGQIWETLIFAELRKLNNFSESPAKLWFYRDQLAREIDFILERGGKLSFIECKWKENPGNTDLKTIKIIHQELLNKGGQIRPGKHWVICSSTNSYNIEDKIKAIGINQLQETLIDFSPN